MSAPIYKFGQKTVAGSASSVTITFATDEEASSGAQFPAGSTVVCTGVPTWATSVRISAISETAVTFQFGTATGTGGGTLYWVAAGR